jgi:hypothetical protein
MGLKVNVLKISGTSLICQRVLLKIKRIISNWPDKRLVFIERGKMGKGYPREGLEWNTGLKRTHSVR